MGSKGIAQRIAASPTKDTKVKEWRYGRTTGNTEEIHPDEKRPCRKLTLLTGLCRDGVSARLGNMNSILNSAAGLGKGIVQRAQKKDQQPLGLR